MPAVAGCMHELRLELACDRFGSGLPAEAPQDLMLLPSWAGRSG
jgi:hypothetical protein